MGVFADCALSLREAGWAVMPAKGKTPKVAGFNKWGRAPGLKGIEKWATSGPDDDIVAVTGLCRPRPDETGVVIVDPDDERAKDVAEDLFGYTPSRVLTRRGWHDGFRLPDGLDINELPTSLRKYGVDLDLKYGRATGIIAMPMSVHEKDHSVCYRWAPGSGPFAISEAPRLPTDKLLRFLWLNRHHVEKAKPEKKEAKGKTPSKDRDDSRHLSLNDALCSKGRYFLARDWSGFLAEAHRLNPIIADRIGNAPLDDEGVMGVVLQVWKGFEEGDLYPYDGDGAFTCISEREYDLLFEICPKRALDAMGLFMKLQFKHGARCRQGETFAISPFAMARDGVIEGWTRERYENARDVLLQAGLISRESEYVRGYKTGIPARYLLTSSGRGAQGAGQSQLYYGENRSLRVSPEAGPFAASQEGRAPWIAARVSRATWFRQKKALQ